MNKTLSLILRITIAMLGLVYIVWVIDWIDHVELAAGNYQTDDGQQVMLEEARAFRVISGDFDPRKVSEPLVLSMGPPVAVMGGRFTVKPEMLTQENTGEEVPRFKLRPGIITTVRHANMGYLLLGLLLIVPIYPITAFRWWLLLRARGLVVQPFHAFRLCMVGCFFNYCMPGSTGGDVIKAYYAAKNSDRRADAVMTVVIDRIVGLLGLFVLAGIAGLFIERDAGVRQVTWFVWAVAGGVVMVSALYFSRHLRTAIGLDWLLTKVLPQGSMLAKIDAAAAAYSQHKGVVALSILLSLPVHLLIAVSTSLAGWALGMETSLTTLLAVVPVVFLVMSIPISPQGVGTAEFVALKLLVQPSLATANQVIVMLMMARLYQLVYSLSGAVFLLKGDIHLKPEMESSRETQAASQGEM